jgi:hypothetical protein
MSATSSPAGQVVHVVSPGITLFGQQIHLTFVTMTDEASRRDAGGLGAVTDRELLFALFELPADIPIARAAVSARQQRLLRRAPQGVVELQRREITRRLVPAIRPLTVMASGRPTVARLRRLSEFAPFAARSMVVDRSPTHIEAGEAARLGITLSHPGGSRVVEGSPFVVRRHTPTSWLFAEEAWAQVLRAGGLAAAPTMPHDVGTL